MAEIAVVEVKLHSAVSAKTGKPYECLRVQVGKWSTLVFTKSQFELDYLKSVLGSNE